MESITEWQESNQWQIIAGLKIGAVVLTILVVSLFFVWQKKQARINQIGISNFGKLINQSANSETLVIPYQQTLYKHFGNAINPQVKLPVKTTTGYKELEFLIDSGAVVSALPQVESLELGVDLNSLPRITIEGFAGSKTFAYRGEFLVKLGDEEIVLPVVFSENPQASNILGRIGFFDQFNIVFDANDKNIIINRGSI